MHTSNRVAYNTIIQYVKLIVNVLAGLVTVRVLLNALGASDYGIYDVVGGIIALLSFVNSSLSQSSIRFLSVSLGKEDIQDTRKVFSNCFWVHLLVSILIVAFLEMLFPFLFDSFLNIPPERIQAAKNIFHFMVIILFLQISITPFNALIVSHERLAFYSLIAIFDSFLKLGIAFIVKYTQEDKLILYGGLMMMVTVVNSVMSVCYSLIKYKQEIAVQRFSLRDSKELINFVGWTLMDILSQISTRQGYSIMFNKICGTKVNAVYAISRQIEGNMYYLSASVIDSMKPQIMKSYGNGDINRMLRLSCTAGKMGFSMMSLVAIPLLVMMPTVLKIWLVDVPEGTVFFARMIVIACMMEQLTRGLVYSCQAMGNIKLFSIIVSTIRILALPLSIVSLLMGASPKYAMIIYMLCESLGSFSRVIIMARLTEMKVVSFFKSVILRVLPPVIVVVIFSFSLYSYSESIYTCFANLVISIVLYVLLCYGITMDKYEKTAIISVIQAFVNRITNR